MSLSSHRLAVDSTRLLQDDEGSPARTERQARPARVLDRPIQKQETEMKKQSKFLLSSIALAVLALTHQACAQQLAAADTPSPSGEQPATAGDKEAADALSRVVVTGSTSLKRTVRESSVAVTVIDREALDRKAPHSTAAAMELIPGIFVEESGGEVSNNFSVRGLAGGAQSFIQLQEDGLPVFYTNALSDTILKQELSIDRLEAVRGGTSGILTVNGAGA
jgi:iron complex outermembrane receptor protein